uniref:Uncharacterized protein n=1 Tax=Chlamydomonas chlamydogama TaxID=225041 RepID=A0A7S2QT39_9CHLO
MFSVPGHGRGEQAIMGTNSGVGSNHDSQQGGRSDSGCGAPCGMQSAQHTHEGSGGSSSSSAGCGGSSRHASQAPGGGGGLDAVGSALSPGPCPAEAAPPAADTCHPLLLACEPTPTPARAPTLRVRTYTVCVLQACVCVCAASLLALLMQLHCLSGCRRAAVLGGRSFPTLMLISLGGCAPRLLNGWGCGL